MRFGASPVAIRNPFRYNSTERARFVADATSPPRSFIASAMAASMLKPVTFWRNGLEHALNASADRKTKRNSPAHSRCCFGCGLFLLAFPMADYLPLASHSARPSSTPPTPRAASRATACAPTGCRSRAGRRVLYPLNARRCHTVRRRIA